MNRDRSDDPELSLAQGVGDLRTQFSLHEAFEQVTATPPEQSNELELPPANQMTTGRGGGLQDVGGASRQVLNQRRAAQQQRSEHIIRSVIIHVCTVHVCIHLPCGS